MDTDTSVPGDMERFLKMGSPNWDNIVSTKTYITIKDFCAANSMVHVTKRTRRRGACFPYPRRTWWAPPHSELLVTRQIYIHFQRAQPHSAVAAWRRRTWRPCKAWALGAKGRHVRTCPTPPSLSPTALERKCKERRWRRGVAARSGGAMYCEVARAVKERRKSIPTPLSI